MKLFPPHLTDFYKTGHIRQYPTGTQYVYSNFTPRTDRLANVLPDFDHKAVFVGLEGVCQWLLMDLWNDEFFNKPKHEVVEKYQKRMDSSLGPGAVSARHIAELYDLGYLPIQIKALPEGSRVNMRVPVFTIMNTHPDFYWVTNYLETQLSAECWKTITSATTAYEFRRLLEAWAEHTGSPANFVAWQGHDFSMRGMSGVHDAAQSGIGHLCSFYGTDTIPAIDYLQEYYDVENAFIGGSVPATEHSVMCMGGSEDELETFRRLIQDVYPGGIVSIVSDTWDFWDVITSKSLKLKPQILNRKPDGLGIAKVVFRPDSGDPVKIICGDPDAEIGSAEYKGAVECLWDIFGGTITATGHRLLNERVGLIYGDSITLSRCQHILSGLAEKNYASANMVFGIGSYTYQNVTRDSFGQALKATWGVVDGMSRELFKDPKTGDGMKKSARGLLRVEKEGDDFVLYDQQTQSQESGGALETVFVNGRMVRHSKLDEIRELLVGHPL